MTTPIDDTLARAEAAYRKGNYEEASTLLEPMVSGEPPHVVALRIMGLCRLRQRSNGEAITLLGRAYALAPADPWVQMHYGMALQALGRSAEALPLLRASCASLTTDPAPFINLSSALLGIGDSTGAIRAARRARLYGPRMAESHYTLGLAYLAANRNNQAGECFQYATRLAPLFSEAWLNLGVAQYRSGQIDAAKNAMRAALRADPKNLAAGANLGAFMRLTGEGEEGEALLRHLIALHPDAIAARVNLAAELLQEDRAAEALTLIEDLAPGERRLRQHWLLQYALALLKLGRIAEARAKIDEVGTVSPDLQPLLNWRLALLSLEEGKVALARTQAGEMEGALGSDSGMLLEHRIMAHFDLAKFWSGLREPDRAFPNWVQGHRILSRFQPFSRQAYESFVDTSIEAFSKKRFLDGPRAENRDEAPVFVVGMPRSGTTLIEQILAAHGHVHGAGERSALTNTVFQLGGRTEEASAVRRIADLDAPIINAAAARYLAELHGLAPDAARIIDKMPGNFRYLGLAALMMPGARIIACDRDPRDIGLSIFTYRFYGHHSYAHDLSDLGWYIGQQRRLMDHWRAVLPNPIMTVRLQDWVEDFTGTLRNVLDFLDLPYDEACETFHTASRRVRTVSRTQVREPINNRGIGRWLPYADHLAPLIEALEQSGCLAKA